MRNRRAFTLIEVAVVLVVLAILAAIAIPTFAAFMDRTAEQSAAMTVASVVEDARALQALTGTALPLTDAALTTAAGETNDEDDLVTYDTYLNSLTVDTPRGSYVFVVNQVAGSLAPTAEATLVGYVFTNRTWAEGFPQLTVTLAEPADLVYVVCPDVAGTLTQFGGPAPAVATATHTLTMTMGPGPGLTPAGSYPGCVVSVRDASGLETSRTTFTLDVA